MGLDTSQQIFTNMQNYQGNVNDNGNISYSRSLVLISGRWFVTMLKSGLSACGGYAVAQKQPNWISSMLTITNKKYSTHDNQLDVQMEKHNISTTMYIFTECHNVYEGNGKVSRNNKNYYESR
jgi:hypothetical protein